MVKREDNNPPADTLFKSTCVNKEKNSDIKTRNQCKYQSYRHNPTCFDNGVEG
jgi:hypothetical protein